MSNNMDDAAQLLERIKSENIEYVDLRFTDPRGKWQHLTLSANALDMDAIEDGVMFDGSSIAGWKAINESDMALMLDPSSAFIDPFFAQPTMGVVCEINEPGTGAPYSRDPRSTARKAAAYLRQTESGIQPILVRKPNSSYSTMFGSK